MQPPAEVFRGDSKYTKIVPRKHTVHYCTWRRRRGGDETLSRNNQLTRVDKPTIVYHIIICHFPACKSTTGHGTWSLSLPLSQETHRIIPNFLQNLRTDCAVSLTYFFNFIYVCIDVACWPSLPLLRHSLKITSVKILPWQDFQVANFQCRPVNRECWRRLHVGSHVRVF